MRAARISQNSGDHESGSSTVSWGDERNPPSRDPTALDDDAVTFVARSVGLDEDRVRLVRDAENIGRETGLPAEVFYGLARERGVDLGPRVLALQPKSRIARALRDAIDQGLVPARLSRDLDKTLARLADALVASSSIQKLARRLNSATMVGCMTFGGRIYRTRDKLDFESIATADAHRSCGLTDSGE